MTAYLFEDQSKLVTVHKDATSPALAEIYKVAKQLADNDITLTSAQSVAKAMALRPDLVRQERVERGVDRQNVPNSDGQAAQAAKAAPQSYVGADGQRYIGWDADKRQPASAMAQLQKLAKSLQDSDPMLSAAQALDQAAAARFDLVDLDRAERGFGH